MSDLRAEARIAQEALVEKGQWFGPGAAPEPFWGFETLSATAIEEGRAALKAIDPTAADDINVVRRLARRKSGEFVLGLRRPLHPLRPENRDQPWECRGVAPGGPATGMLWEQVWYRLDEGLQILRSDESFDREVDRREKLWAEREERIRIEQLAMESRRDQQNLRDAEDRRRVAKWGQLTPWQRAQEALAVALDSTHPEIAKALRFVAADVGESLSARAEGPRMPARWQP